MIKGKICIRFAQVLKANFSVCFCMQFDTIFARLGFPDTKPLIRLDIVVSGLLYAAFKWETYFYIDGQQVYSFLQITAVNKKIYLK